MSTGLSRTEIVNLALLDSGHNVIDSFETSDSDIAQKARIFYKLSYDRNMSKFPWNFATKREQLTRLQEVPSDNSYLYFYEVPADARYKWEIYSTYDYGGTTGRAIQYLSTYYHTDPNSISNSYVLRAIGEVYDNKIASKYTELFMQYTPKQEVSATLFSQEFIDLMIAEMSMLFYSMKGASAEEQRIKDSMYRRNKRGLMTRASRENKDAYFASIPVILRNTGYPERD